MLARLCAALAALALASSAAAQGFPAKPVTLIVPWPPGGSTDLCMRALAEAASKHLGQPIVVENRPGAAGSLGAAALVNARPDGYTLAQIPQGVFRMPYTTKTSYDPMSDVTYIIGVAGYAFGVAVRSDAPWKTWQELVAYAKANPGKLSYGTPGANTILHVTMEQFADANGIKWVHVPYKGDAENMQALLGGHIDASATASAWVPHVESGKMRVLVTWGANRAKRSPDTPTLKELGYGIVANSPYGIGGPKGMDPAIVRTLHDAFRKALEDPGYLRTLDRFDQEVVYLATDDYARFARETYASEKATMEFMKGR
jgi:tripartite-type tricarboxylate transporter receptor subunit TctC